jgi:hypothetical protein
MVPTVTLLASLAIAVGGTLFAFWMGVRAGAKSVSPVAPPNHSHEFQQFLYWLRLPRHALSSEQFSIWHKNLRIFGVPLATRLHPNIYITLADALEAIHDVLQANEIEDRYELLAAALLPVYEACGALAVTPLAAPSNAAAEPAPDAELARFSEREDRKPLESSRIPVGRKNRLLQQIVQASQAATHDRSASKQAAFPAAGSPPPRLRYETAASPPSSIPVAPLSITADRPLDTSELSKTLASILKASADEEAHANAVESAGSALHLVRENFIHDSHAKSRLKRTPAATPEEDAARKAAHAVGRAREWMGRPDITLRDVAVACGEFGLEFDERYAQLELQKALPEEYAPI